MPLNHFMILNGHHQRFGEIVKQLARSERPLPKSIEKFKLMLDMEGVQAIWPTGEQSLENIRFIIGRPETLHIRLPPVESLDDVDALLAQPGSALSPPLMYFQAFGTPATVTNEEAFNSARIADLTIAL